ncbi:MarR family winged helix-turn-helix transcriptional regulator [Flaviaesturariibacter amylovorans]|uniref:HTH marR-type domain-containing protein n=1 Tax=Flaviaesturariibacter amylovorans TaxID=1084520 RepID=A0ABP8GFI7_9BACT
MGKLVELMGAWEKFTAAHPDGTLPEFGAWLACGNDVLPDATPDAAPMAQQLALQAGYLLAKLNQYVAVYAKPLVRRHGLNSLDDFGYLATVQQSGPLSKSRACALMLQEVTTGNDIIRRLVSRGLVRETPDVQDRRQKLLHLTPEGAKLLFSLFEGFRELPDVLGPLPLPERRALLDWLGQLDRHHQQVLAEMRRSV